MPHQVANYGHSGGGGPEKIHCGMGHKYISYVQGQSPRKGIREYFYYIDHQGQVIIQILSFHQHTSTSRLESLKTARGIFKQG